jgi:hypothetical protein
MGCEEYQYAVRYKMLHEEEITGKQQQGIECPYIHNYFFLPRDSTITMTPNPKT